MTTNDHRPVLRGELVLVLAVIINSIGVLLMLHSGSGMRLFQAFPMLLIWYYQRFLLAHGRISFRVFLSVYS